MKKTVLIIATIFTIGLAATSCAEDKVLDSMAVEKSPNPERTTDGSELSNNDPD